MTLNESGATDPLYANFPREFTAQFGHNDQVSQLPKGAVNLASTELCPIQSYRLQDRLVYATQFHPEMSHAENQERAMGYLQVYDVNQTTPDKLAQMFRPSNEASGSGGEIPDNGSGTGIAAGRQPRFQKLRFLMVPF